MSTGKGIGGLVPIPDLLSNSESTSKADRGAYYRQYRAANRDKLRAHDALYYAMHREQHLARCHQWYINNRKHWIEHVKEQYRANPAPIKERATKWNKQHPERRKEIYSTSSKRHPETYRAAWRRRHARKLGNGGTHTAADIAHLYAQQRGRCAACGKSLARGYEVDHVQPLLLGGSNDPENLQLLCKRCNRSKGALSAQEWAAKLEKLFV